MSKRMSRGDGGTGGGWLGVEGGARQGRFDWNGEARGCSYASGPIKYNSGRYNTG